MKLIHRFNQLTPEKRPQDPNMDGTGLRFETMERGGEYQTPCPKPSGSSMPKTVPASTSRPRKMAEWSTAKDTSLIWRKIDAPRPSSTGIDADDVARTEADHHMKWFDMRDLAKVILGQ